VNLRGRRTQLAGRRRRKPPAPGRAGGAADPRLRLRAVALIPGLFSHRLGQPMPAGWPVRDAGGTDGQESLRVGTGASSTPMARARDSSRLGPPTAPPPSRTALRPQRGRPDRLGVRDRDAAGEGAGESYGVAGTNVPSGARSPRRSGSAARRSPWRRRSRRSCCRRRPALTPDRARRRGRAHRGGRVAGHRRGPVGLPKQARHLGADRDRQADGDRHPGPGHPAAPVPRRGRGGQLPLLRRRARRFSRSSVPSCRPGGRRTARTANIGLTGPPPAPAGSGPDRVRSSTVG
jgi:hypothetical protein